MNGEMSFDNVKSMDVFPSEEKPEETWVQFFCGEVMIGFVLTDEQRRDLVEQLAVPERP